MGSLEDLTEQVRARARDYSALDGTVKLHLDDTGVIYIDAGASPPVVNNEDDEADCVIRMSADNFAHMIAGKLRPMMAFMTGKIKVEGDMSIAMKFGDIL